VNIPVVGKGENHEPLREGTQHFMLPSHRKESTHLHEILRCSVTKVTTKYCDCEHVTVRPSESPGIDPLSREQDFASLFTKYSVS
jgi:hypothetical protein